MLTAYLLACDHDGSGQVSFYYRDSQSGETKVRTLPGADVLHLILHQVLPRGLSAGEELRHPASEQEGLDRAAAPHAQDRTAPAGAGQTPAGVCLSLLRQADADPTAATSADGGQSSCFRTGNGGDRVSLSRRHDGTTTGATASLGSKCRKTGRGPQNRSNQPTSRADSGATSSLSWPAGRIPGSWIKSHFQGNKPRLFNNRFRSWIASRSRTNLNR